MPSAGDLVRERRDAELWQMCCGFLKLNLHDFMEIQRRLLLEQIERLKDCPLGVKIMRGARPRTVEEFREQVPLTTYADYCPELIEKREDVLPEKPDSWVRTSGRSGEYKCRWVPMTPEYAQELSIAMFGVGMLAGCEKFDDKVIVPVQPKVVYSVAPRPYMSGVMTSILLRQTPVQHLPGLEEAEDMTFEDRMKLGFKQALSQGIDYFFGMSLALVMVGEKFAHSSGGVNIRPLLKQPKALLRLAKGIAKSKMARRPMLPKDLWKVKGIISSGLDSCVYREKIREFWGRMPLDVYVATEGGLIASQLWDYDSMVFTPNLNFIEFIPEEEHLKWQQDRSYQPGTVLLDEVEAGENYEVVLTNFHGGALVRYRIGDIIKITSLRNEKLGIDMPQMAFERRTDDILYFVAVKLTEKHIWQSIQNTGIPYADWTAFKEPGKPVLHLLIELKNDDYQGREGEIAAAVREQMLILGKESYDETETAEDWRESIDFQIDVTLLPHGAFANYIAQRQAEGADLAHIKPPHINPSQEVLDLLLVDAEETIIVTRARRAAAEGEKTDKIAV